MINVLYWVLIEKRHENPYNYAVMKNILLKIEYDGTNFCGWQVQPNGRTVQSELERVLSELCREKIQIQGTSRTDSGVHAYGQQANFFTDSTIPADRIKFAVNNWLPEDVQIREVKEVPKDFHARFSAKGKKYIYKIVASNENDVFSRKYCYNVGRTLDLEKMRQAAAHIVGTHDFACFRASGANKEKSTERTVHSLKLIDDAQPNNNPNTTTQTINLEIIGNAFLYNMVRIITGTLIDVGHGKIPPDMLIDIIQSKDRQRARHTAPPQGLYLSEIYFNEDYKQIK